MGLTGAELGAELGNIYKMGKQILPGVADDFNSAYLNTPVIASSNTQRGGGLGADPGPAMDGLLEKLNKATQDTETTLRDVADRLVWTANDFKTTDTEAMNEFDRRRKEIDG